MEKPLTYSKASHNERHTIEDNISPISAMPLIQSTLTELSASNTGGSFVSDDFTLKLPTA